LLRLLKLVSRYDAIRIMENGDIRINTLNHEQKEGMKKNETRKKKKDKWNKKEMKEEEKMSREKIFLLELVGRVSSGSSFLYVVTHDRGPNYGQA
jgi:hypothetical protein